MSSKNNPEAAVKSQESGYSMLDAVKNSITALLSPQAQLEVKEVLTSFSKDVRGAADRDVPVAEAKEYVMHSLKKITDIALKDMDRADHNENGVIADATLNADVRKLTRALGIKPDKVSPEKINAKLDAFLADTKVEGGVSKDKLQQKLMGVIAPLVTNLVNSEDMDNNGILNKKDYQAQEELFRKMLEYKHAGPEEVQKAMHTPPVKKPARQL